MKFEDVLKELLTKQTPKWSFRVKRRKRSAVSRLLLLQVLKDVGKPVTCYELAFLMGSSYEGVLRNVRVLQTAKVVCDKLTNGMSQSFSYTICPVCPVKEQCLEPLEIWKNTTL